MTEWEREVVVRLELDDLLLPRMIELFLPTQLTVSPFPWKKNSLDSQLLLRISLPKSPRTISVRVTMTIKDRSFCGKVASIVSFFVLNINITLYRLYLVPTALTFLQEI